jgi:hypothetical protein
MRRLGLSRVYFWEKHGADVAQIFMYAFYGVYGALLERRPPASSKFRKKIFASFWPFLRPLFYAFMARSWSGARSRAPKLYHTARDLSSKNIKKNMLDIIKHVWYNIGLLTIWQFLAKGKLW